MSSLSSRLDAFYTDPRERYEVANAISNEIARRFRAEANAPTTKKCYRCQETLPIEDFHRDEARTSGRHPYCRACRR